jgi:hypothetical protein
MAESSVHLRFGDQVPTISVLRNRRTLPLASTKRASGLSSCRAPVRLAQPMQVTNPAIDTGRRLRWLCQRQAGDSAGMTSARPHFLTRKKSRIGGRPPSPANQIPPQGSTGLGWCFSIVQHNRDLCIVGKPRWVGHRHAAPGGIHILPGKPWGYAKWLLARSGRLQGIPESEGRHRFSRPGIFSPEGLHRSSSLAAKRDRIPEKRKAASLT